ncbi:MAG TPA: ThuA domain-containing protein [Solirubrobacter sp.]
MATAAAKTPPTKLNSISSPPSSAAPGQSFTLSGRVTNSTSKKRSATIKVTLLRTKSGSARTVGSAKVSIKSRKTLSYKVKIKLPANLAEAAYYVRGCATFSGEKAACLYAARRVTVKKSSTHPAGNPVPTPTATPVPTPSTPAATATPTETATPTPTPTHPTKAFKVLVFTNTSDATARAGISAIQAVADASSGDNQFSVDAPADAKPMFTDKTLDNYRAVIFLDTGASSGLSDAQRAAFERYYQRGGGFFGIGSAIETDPSWQFLTDVLGTRSTTTAGGSQAATVVVADKVHEASKSLPEYWNHQDVYYNYSSNVRGFSHVLATVVEDPFEAQPQGPPLNGISGGTMGSDHPVLWCKDFKNGRSFYSGVGSTSTSFRGGSFASLLKGAIDWTAGVADPITSDCGATVLANYVQTPVTRNPNLEEPVSFTQLPDGRILQTSRRGTLRLHDPKSGVTSTIATIPVYTNSEDGLYGPGIDNNFSTDHWVYVYYAPPTVDNIKFADGTTGHTVTTDPTGSAPAAAASLSAWDQWIGYFQLSRFKFVDDGNGAAHLDMGSEQQILRVSNNRGACCHVAGDMAFDKHNNLWFVTGDDSAAGSGDAGNWGQSIDQKYDDTQTVRLNGATGGTFTLTLSQGSGPQTTAPLAYNASAAAIQTALEALPNVGAGNVQVTGTGTVDTAAQTVLFKGIYEEKDVAQLTANTGTLTGTTPAAAITTTREGGWFRAPHTDSARSALNTNDLRGKVNRIHIKEGDIAPADFNKADLTGDGHGAYTIPKGNLFPLVGGAPQTKTRPEIYAMGFRNPFRITVDENDVAYISDYSPDSQTPQQYHGPAGTGRYEIVRHPANYGWPYCFKPDLPEYPWNVNLQVPMNALTHQPVPAGQTPQPYSCGGASVPNNDYWNTNGGPGIEPGLTQTPALTAPDIWYSYRDNNTSAPLGTPCFTEYGPDANTAPIAKGSTTPCPRLFPDLYTGGVAPHGIAKYKYDPLNPNTTKFPPYYDDKIVLGEFGQNTLRELILDSQNHVQKINQFMNCTAQTAATLGSPTTPFECTNPMDMFWGSDGDFYLMTYGNGFFNINPGAAIFKWSYQKGQRPPVAVVKADKTDGALPLTVKFSSVGSNTPEPSESISYSWNFGDGSPLSTDPNPTHVYDKAGVYTAVLTVTASSGKTAAASLKITAGNTSPTVTVNTPVEGGLFSFGQNIPYSVTVSDPEDGAIDCSKVVVTFVLGHDNHGHAEEGTTGCTGVLHTVPGDVSHGGNVFGVVSASYTDKGGVGGTPSLSTTGQHNIRQKHQEVEFAVNQSGTNTGNNNDGGPSAPGTTGVHRGSLAAGDWIQLNGPLNLDTINSITYRVADAADGRTAGSPLAAVEIREDNPTTGPIVQTNNLVSTGAAATWTSQTFPIAPTGALAGTHEYFLVFRTVTNGATGGNLFNLNWVEFTGPGVGTTP